jgi:hypothetical protein
MIYSLPIVKCIKGAEGILEEGHEYTVCGVSKKGNFHLMEVDPPEPYTVFDSSRFEDTGRSHFFEFNDDHLEDNIPQEEVNN